MFVFITVQPVLPLPKNGEKKGKKQELSGQVGGKISVYIKDRPVFLVCGVNMAITKEYNIR